VRTVLKLAAAAVALCMVLVPGMISKDTVPADQGIENGDLTGDIGEAVGLGTTEAPQPVESEDADLRSWTVAMYWDADNDLDSFTETFIGIWKESLTNRVDVALSAYIDGLTTPANYSTLTEDGWEEVRALGELNSSDPKTLSDFITFTMTEPTLAAEHYMLVIQDHGLGYIGICVEESEPNRPWMSIDGLGRAIGDAKAATGKMLDIIELDACSMALVEVAYELRDKAGYLVASEKAVPFDGLNYRALLGGLSADPDTAPLDLAIKMVDDYEEWYTAPLGTYPTLYPYLQDFASLSVLDLSKMQPIADAFAALGEAILPTDMGLKGPMTEAAKSAMVAMWENCMGCDYTADIRVMFTEFGRRIRDSYPTVAEITDKIVAAADDIIVHDWASWRFRGRETGMSVFVCPGEGMFYLNWDTTWNRVYNELDMDFVTDTGWDEVLLSYFGSQKMA